MRPAVRVALMRKAGGGRAGGSGDPGVGGGGGTGTSGGGGSSYTPQLDYSDARNSQYTFLLFLW